MPNKRKAQSGRRYAKKPSGMAVRSSVRPDSLAKRIISKAVKLIGAFLHFTFWRLPWAIVVTCVALFLITSLAERRTAINPISVPKELADKGYTPDVAAQRLRDALGRFAKKPFIPQTRRLTEKKAEIKAEKKQEAKDSLSLRPKRPDPVQYAVLADSQRLSAKIALAAEVPNFIVPTTGLSFGTIETLIRDSLGIVRNRSISGEIFIRDHLLWLRIRVDGREVYNSPEGAQTPDELFVAAAPRVFEEIRPYIVAAHNWKDQKALGIVDRILAEHERTRGFFARIVANLFEADEDVVMSYALRGAIYTNRQNYPQAIENCEKAIELGPQSAIGHYIRGNLYHERGYYEDAIADYSELIRLDPGNGSWFVVRGDAYSDKGDYDSAIADYDKAISLQPDLAIAYSNRDIAYRKKGAHLAIRDNGTSIADYSDAISHNPKDARAYMDRGDAYLKEANYEAAVADYEKGIELDPKNPLVYINRGYAYFFEGQYERAIADYDKAIELDPENTIAYRNRANALAQRGKYERAIADYSELIRLDPGNAGDYIDRGAAYYTLEDYDSAMADFSEAIRLDPKYALAYGNRSAVYTQQGDYERAITDLIKLVQLNPNDADAYLRLGFVYAQQGDYERATAEYSRAIELDPKNAVAYGNLAYVLLLTHDFGNALEAADKAIALAPDQIWLHMNRAHSLMFLERVDEARALYYRYRGEIDVHDGKSWEEVVLDDFKALRKVKLKSSLMVEITELFQADVTELGAKQPERAAK